MSDVEVSEQPPIPGRLPLRLSDDPQRFWARFVHEVLCGNARTVTRLTAEILAADARYARHSPRSASATGTAAHYFSPSIGDAPSGMRQVSWEVVELLNETSSTYATARELRREYAQLEGGVLIEAGGDGVDLLELLARETSEHYLYPEGAWPSGNPPEPDPLTLWCALSGSAPEHALLLAARISEVANRITAQRLAAAAIALSA